MDVLENQQWLLSLGTFLPLAGVLVMLFIPKRDEALVKGTAVVTALATVLVGAYTLVKFDYGQAAKQQFFTTNDWIRRSRRPTRSGWTASACRSTCCRW